MTHKSSPRCQPRNKANLKSYALQTRKDFIAAVTARANLLGLSDKGGRLEVAPAQTQGDVTVIAGQAWPAKASFSAFAWSVDEVATCLAPFKVQRAAVAALKTHLAALSQVLALVKQSGDVYAAAATADLPICSSASRDQQRAALSVNRELVLLH